MKVEHDPLSTVPTIGVEARESLKACGYETVDDVRDAAVEELKEVPCVGEAKPEFLVYYLEQ